MRLAYEKIGKKADFVVISMFTDNVESDALRLRESLDKHELSYALYRVPSIHRSISTRGSDDLRFCKPSFILQALERFDRPVLFLDADILVREFPVKIAKISSGSADLAAYNFLADENTDAFLPIEIQYQGEITRNRFYRYSYSVDLFDPIQFLSAGAVLYFRNSRGSRSLLDAWRATIEKYPIITDDQSLDYAFNFLMKRRLKTEWLPKNYCRYGFWIYARPIIDHPHIPSYARTENFISVTGKDRLNMDRVTTPKSTCPLPRSGTIDVIEKRILHHTSEPARLEDCTSSKIDIPLWPASA